jgi:hypothetical protein
MDHQTTDAYSSFGNKIALYIQRATLGLFPKSCPWLFYLPT